MADTNFLATLDDPTLFREANYINGLWLEVGEGRSITVTNPATGKVLGRVPSFGVSETALAIAAAKRAQPAWRALTAKERAVKLRHLFELMITHREDLARIMTAEQGKPLAESRGEITYAASFIEWFAEEGKRVYGDTIASHSASSRIIVQKEPIGVFAAITPWNFPAAMITRKAGPGWAAGCTGVLRPASQTPFSAIAIAVLAERAGLPAGVCNVITGPGSEIGAELTSNPDVRKAEEHVADAVERGASVLVGGERHPLGGSFYRPTILVNVPRESKVFREETFGPVAPLFRFSTEAQAIEMANDTEFGLASYFYSRDIGRIMRVAEALECGIVGINEGLISTEVAPFGGVKSSGLGREGSKYGIEDYLEIKYLCLGGIDR